MISPSCIGHLERFINEPTASNASHLMSAPAIYRLLAYEIIEKGGVSAEVLGICRWLFGRASSVMERLSSYPAPGVCEQGSLLEEDWRKV